MGILYFFFLGIIFTMMSLENNNALVSKKLLINKHEKAPTSKVIFGILTAWFFAGNALLFLNMTLFFITQNIEHSSKLVNTIFKYVSLINIFVMPFVLYKKMLIRDKNKQ